MFNSAVNRHRQGCFQVGMDLQLKATMITHERIKRRPTGTRRAASGVPEVAGGYRVLATAAVAAFDG